MKALCRFVASLIFIFACSTSFAKVSDWRLSNAAQDYGLSLFGASYQLNGHTLVITIDQNNVLSHLNEQMSDGVYNSNYTKDYFLGHPIIYLLASALNATTFIIPRIYYDHPGLNYINVFVRIKYENLLGNDAIGSLLSFNMSRSLNNQINWTRFNPTNAMDVYPAYQMSNLTWSEFIKEFRS